MWVPLAAATSAATGLLLANVRDRAGGNQTAARSWLSMGHSAPDRSSRLASSWRKVLFRRCRHILRRRSGVERRMNEADRHGALAYRRCAAFDRSAPNVSRGEHARKAGLQEKRRPALCAPEVAAHRIERNGGAGHDETLLVKLHAATQPLGVGIGPDEEEQRRCLDPRLDAGIVAEADGLEMTVSFQRGHRGAAVNLHVVDLLDAIHEVP